MEKELFEQVFDFMKKKTNDPEEIMTALAKCMAVVIPSCIQYFDDHKGVHQECVRVIDEIKRMADDALAEYEGQ